MSHGLTFPFPSAPDHGIPFPVADGVWWMRLPLPYALNHINVWLLQDGPAAVAMVDTGVPDSRTRTYWSSLFDGGLRGRTVSRLLVTHFHPDHMGLAAWMCRRFGLTVEMTMSEWLYGRMLSQDPGDEFTDISLEFYRAAGFTPSLLDMTAQRGNAFGARVRHTPPRCRSLRDGQDIEIGGHRWRVITAEGHSPEMACFYCEDLNLLISGDQILPTISPNISVWPNQPTADPLTLFLASMERFKDLPDDVLVLPSHGLPFRGIHLRLAALAGHHRDRLADILSLCSGHRGGLTALEIMGHIFRRDLDDHQLYFAIGETLAHLHMLERQGSIVRRRQASGVDLWGD